MRSRHPRVAADVGPGFPVAEARALQTALEGALTAVERAAGRSVPVELRFEPGAGPGVVVVCRNRVVGFVPPDRAPGLRGQLTDAGRRAHLVAPGVLHRQDGLWRAWAGAEPEDGVPPAPDGLDTMAAPDPAVLGIPLRRG